MIKFLNIKILMRFQIHTDGDKILVVKYWSFYFLNWPKIT